MRFLICIITGLFLTVVYAPPKQTEQLPEDILKRTVSGSDLEFLSTRNVLYSSLWRTHLPGGMASVEDCEPDTLLQSWKPQDSPLRQVLDTLIATDPRYRWEVRDGVVNLMPAASEPALLRTRINEFDVEDVSSVRQALSRLQTLPEVEKRMHDLHLKWGIAIVTGSELPIPAKSFVKQKGGTLRQALNAIALAQGRAIWEYIEIHCEGRNQVVIRF